MSPNRMKRPWLGQIENYIENPISEFDPENPFCPEVKRGNGELNPDYEGTFIFNNDFPALMETAPENEEKDESLFKTKPAVGFCKVMCHHHHFHYHLIR